MNEYWNDKRICVTGGAGFLGSFIVEKLQAQGANVFVPRKRNYDLVDLSAIKRLLVDADPEIVIHAAAKGGGIGVIDKFPAEFFYENIMMGIPLLHAAWQHKVEKFIAIGTTCSYPEKVPLPFKEEDLWDGYPEKTNASYGLAKKMLLVQAQAYRQQHSFNAVNLLIGNLYGPRDDFNLQTSHVIPALIRKFLEAQERGDSTVELWGDGSPTRDFLYVEDAAEGILLAAEHYDGEEPVNLGSGMEISIKDLAEMIGKLTGYAGEFVWDTSKPNGQQRRALDVERAKQHFGFEAQMPFEEGLRRTIDWYNKQKDGILSH